VHLASNMTLQMAPCLLYIFWIVQCVYQYGVRLLDYRSTTTVHTLQCICNRRQKNMHSSVCERDGMYLHICVSANQQGASCSPAHRQQHYPARGQAFALIVVGRMGTTNGLQDILRCRHSSHFSFDLDGFQMK
jgi:hypothetical protein